MNNNYKTWTENKYKKKYKKGTKIKMPGLKIQKLNENNTKLTKQTIKALTFHKIWKVFNKYMVLTAFLFALSLMETISFSNSFNSTEKKRFPISKFTPMNMKFT